MMIIFAGAVVAIHEAGRHMEKEYGRYKIRQEEVYG